MNVPPIAITSLKAAVRTASDGLASMGGSEYRSFLWPALPSYAGKESTVIDMQALEDPTITALNLLQVYMRPSRSSKNEVLAMLAETKSIDPLFFLAPLDIFAKVLPSLDVCYLVCCNIINNSNENINYIPLTIQRHLERLLVFKEILNSYMPKTAAALEAIKALDFEYLDLMFKNFFTSILPDVAINSIMDSFLIEGQKVLFRYAIALMRMFKGKVKSGTITTAKQFWDMIQIEFKVPSNAEVIAKVTQLREFAFESGRFILFKAIRPMKIGRREIAEYLASVRVIAYPKFDSDGSVKQYSSKLTNAPIDNLTNVIDKYPNVDRACELHKYLLREKKSSLTFGSNSIADFLTDSCVPPKYHHSQFFLAFSTAEHGFGLGQLYRTIENTSPCLVLIKLAKGTIGFFLDDCLSPPSPIVRGTALTAVFRLDSPHEKIFRWCALDAAAAVSDEKFAGVESTISEQVKNFLCLANRECIQLGTSSSFKSAIHIDDSMRRCSLGVSETFSMKEPLVPTDSGSDSDSFDICLLEVFCLLATKKK